MFGVQINFINGNKDWIDPVENEPEEDGENLIVHGIYKYTFPLATIKNWERYGLCQKCNYDKRSYDCTDDECLSPR